MLADCAMAECHKACTRVRIVAHLHELESVNVYSQQQQQTLPISCCLHIVIVIAYYFLSDNRIVGDDCWCTLAVWSVVSAAAATATAAAVCCWLSEMNFEFSCF